MFSLQTPQKMYITRRILAGAKKSWVPSTKGNKETHNIPMHTTDRMYAIEHEPFVPELHRYVTYFFGGLGVFFDFVPHSGIPIYFSLKTEQEFCEILLSIILSSFMQLHDVDKAGVFLMILT